MHLAMPNKFTQGFPTIYPYFLLIIILKYASHHSYTKSSEIILTQDPALAAYFLHNEKKVLL